MRILYSFASRLGATGVGQTAAQQILALDRRGVDLTVMAPSCELPLPERIERIETMRLGGMRLPIRRVGGLDPRAWHDRRVARTLSHRGQTYDAVHCWPSTSAATLRAARRAGVPSFLERPNCHTRFAMEVVAREFQTLGLEQPPDHPHTFDEVRLRRQELEYQLADFLLCPSEFVAASFERYGFPPQRLVRNHQYGCDVAGFRPGERQGSGPFRLVFVGRGEVRKGLHYALRAWRESGAADRSAEFHICGEFDEDYRSYLASGLNSPGVSCHGFVRNVESFMADCDALILPSIEEGSALVTYEARASGCVLLVSDAAGARCTHGLDALVHRAGDVAALRSQIDELSSNPKLLDSLRKASLATVHELSWDAAAEKLCRAYKSAGGRSAIFG